LSNEVGARELLQKCRPGAREAERIVVIVAHPDDEVIGVGARLCTWRDVRLVYATNGAPRDMRDAYRVGLSSREAYATLRRAERERALRIAGVDPARVHELGFSDQETARELVDCAARVAVLLRGTRPRVVITHPYEGGHPDHDACAFAVSAAVAMLARDGVPAPTRLEMSSYHVAPNGISTGTFLPSETALTDDARLPLELRDRKRAMFACFGSQRQTLRYFDCAIEPLRIAPRYRFGTPPHDGVLFYENFDWGITGHEWRALARGAAHALGLSGQMA